MSAIPDFEYKKKPYPKDLPTWFKTIRLEPAKLVHLKPIPDQR